MYEGDAEQAARELALVLEQHPTFGLAHLFQGLALTETVSGVQHEVDRLGVQIEQDFSLCARPLPRQAGLLYRAASWMQLPASPASASVLVAAPVSSSPFT